MKVFIAGASGILGKRVAKLLLERGDEVAGMTRSRPEVVAETGATPVVVDAFDAPSVKAAVTDASPDVIVHALSRIPHAAFPLPSRLKENNLLRIKGTANLLEAANAAGVHRVIAESITFAFRGRREEKMRPLSAMRSFQPAVDAVVDMESQVLKVGGVALRFAFFYGPGTAVDEKFPQALRRRSLPIIGQGTGWWSFIHIDDAASATVAAIDNAKAGEAYNIADDEPILARDALAVISEVSGTPRPLRIPAGPVYAREFFNESTGALNEKARRELNWAPAYPTFKEGFPATYSPAR